MTFEDMFPHPSPESPAERLSRKAIGKCVAGLRGEGLTDPEIRETILDWAQRENDLKEASFQEGSIDRFRHQVVAMTLVQKTARVVDEILGSATACPSDTVRDGSVGEG